MERRVWDLVEDYVRSDSRFLTRHQLESYDDFTEHKVVQTIRTLNDGFVVLKIDEGEDSRGTTEIQISVGGPDGSRLYLDKPTYTDGDEARPMTPNDARLRGLTYASRLLADVDVRVSRDGAVESLLLEKVVIGSLPIMLHSSLCLLKGTGPQQLRQLGECPYDQGGYFIVDGKEKVIISQLRAANNVMFVAATPDDPTSAFVASMRCTTDADSVFPKTVRMSVRRKDSAVRLSVRGLEDVPVFHVFRMLGVESDREILAMVLGSESESRSHASAVVLDFLHGSIVDGGDVGSQAEAVRAYAPRMSPPNAVKLLSTLMDDLFVNVDAGLRAKAFFLAFLVRRLAETALAMRPVDDRDDLRNKRIDLAGVLLAGIFRDFYNEMRTRARTYVDGQYNMRARYDARVDVRKIFAEPHRVFDADVIASGLRASLKGRWGLQSLGFAPIDGIVQDLNRVSYMGYVSHVRRVSAPLSDAAKIREPHALYGSHWGYVCPAESPDGPNIGLLVHLATACHVTSDAAVGPVLDVLVREHGMVPLSEIGAPDLGPKTTKVFANGTLRGVLRRTAGVGEVAGALRRNKLRGDLGSRYVSVAWRIADRELHVFTEGGRPSRPLLVPIEAEALPGSWHDAVTGERPCIEFLDPFESNDALIAPGPEVAGRQYTHRELHPALALSPYTGSIPFCNHNPAARNVFSAAQGKQAVGVFASNFESRMDVASYVLHYGQRPLVTTRMSDVLRLSALPSGENLVVAIASFTGYNQEDSVIFNRASLERGTFNITAFKTHTYEEDAAADDDGITNLVFAPSTRPPRFAIYDALDPDGFPRENAVITEDHALLGTRVVNTSKRGGVSIQERDEFADKTFYGTVDRVFVARQEAERAPAGTRICRVRLRQMRVPELGDKVASRHGQKGVVGAVFAPEDMPFRSDGTAPDLIINPHAFPSRMTVAHLMETLAAKWAVVAGANVDGTAFESRATEAMGVGLEALSGMHRSGSEIMYNPRTGEPLAADVFVGPTFYMRLKHMVRDKINFRSTGPVDPLTRQPKQGRANDGGLRIGEMERDAILAHGACAMLKESFMERSDKYVMDVRDGRAQCPYAFKLLTQEIAGLFGVDCSAHTSASAGASAGPWEPALDVIDEDGALEDDVVERAFGEGA